MTFNKTTLLSAASAIALIASAGTLSAAEKNADASAKSSTQVEKSASASSSEGMTTSAANANANAGIVVDDLVGRNVTTAGGDEVGDIESVIIDQQGNVAAVIIGVGGFLGIGEREVAIDWNDLNVSEDGKMITTAMTKADMKQLPEYEYEKEEYRRTAFTDRAYLDSRENRGEIAANDRNASEPTALQKAGDKAEATGDRAASEAEQAKNEAKSSAKNMKSDAEQGADKAEKRMDSASADARDEAQWTAAKSGVEASELMGTTVVNAEGESIGEVDDVIVAESKTQLIISVGEFLGMGGHHVAIDYEKAKVMQRADDADDLRVSLDMSKDELKNLPKYEAEADAKAKAGEKKESN